jgi:hypothetical protein
LVYYLILSCGKEPGWGITAGFAGANVERQFSGKGHKIHVCKRCKARPKSEREAIEDKDIFALLEQSHISERGAP